MDRTSYFIYNLGIFGCYPDTKMISELTSVGVRHFVNLTTPADKLIPYILPMGCQMISHPITDHQVPKNPIQFGKLVIKLVNLLKDGHKIYVHCRGGHGRSGVLVACILCQFYKCNPTRGLRQTRLAHAERENMGDRWRKLGSPQNAKQKRFVMKMFLPIFFYKTSRSGMAVGFGERSEHPVTIQGLGQFNNSESAYQALKNKGDKEYVEKLLKCADAKVARSIGSSCKLEPDWDDRKVDMMELVIRNKVAQNPSIANNLTRSSLRPIVKNTEDMFWGDGICGNGLNVYGKILEKIRDELMAE